MEQLTSTEILRAIEKLKKLFDGEEGGGFRPKPSNIDLPLKEDEA